VNLRFDATFNGAVWIGDGYGADSGWAGRSWGGRSWAGPVLVRQHLVGSQLRRPVLVRQHLERRRRLDLRQLAVADQHAQLGRRALEHLGLG
jgi:hypothetical protein